jgi:hypothetical protein
VLLASLNDGIAHTADVSSGMVIYVMQQEMRLQFLSFRTSSKEE